MATTTLRIEPVLRERITQLAHALNQTPHNFMLEALAEKADEAEWKLSMQREAQQRDAALQAGESGVEWHEMRTYLRGRLSEAGTASNSKPEKGRATSFWPRRSELISTGFSTSFLSTRPNLPTRASKPSLPPSTFCKPAR